VTRKRKFRISNRLRIKLRTLLYIFLGWSLFSLFLIAYNHMLLNSSENYDLKSSVVGFLFGVFLAAILGGTLIVFFLRRKLRRLPLGLSLLIYFLVFTLLIIFISFASSFIYVAVAFKRPLWHQDVWTGVEKYLIQDYGLLLNLLTWLSVAIITIFTMQISEKFGRVVFRNLLVGKYYVPKEEDRIFMFLDLKSSTAIAEKLGSVLYFKFLNDFIEDASLPIIENFGEIYQYVGDEVIITWPLEKGINEARCIRCFFQIDAVIKRHRDRYLNKYGTVPEFKAGLHCGRVAVGEVGTYKKDIVYSGDVLNTASRIQELCNKHDAEFLVSGELLDILEVPGKYRISDIGVFELRGRSKPAKLFRIDLPEEQVVPSST